GTYLQSCPPRRRHRSAEDRRLPAGPPGGPVGVAGGTLPAGAVDTRPRRLSSQECLRPKGPWRGASLPDRLGDRRLGGAGRRPAPRRPDGVLVRRPWSTGASISRPFGVLGRGAGLPVSRGHQLGEPGPRVRYL